MFDVTPPTGGAPAPRLPLRPYAAFGRICYATPEPEPVDPAPPVPPKPAAKIELTTDELDAKIAAAVKARDDAAAEQKSKDDAESQRKADEAKGEWEKVAKTAQSERDAERAERRKLTISTSLSTHLIDKHPDYAKAAKYIMPLIPADTKDADLAKAIETATAEFVKDNPRQAARTSGVPTARTDARTSPGRQAAAPVGADGYLARTYPGPASLRRAISN